MVYKTKAAPYSGALYHLMYLGYRQKGSVYKQTWDFRTEIHQPVPPLPTTQLKGYYVNKVLYK
jgi:hypothetical protein